MYIMDIRIDEMKNTVYFFSLVNIKPLENSKMLDEHKDVEGAYVSCVASGENKRIALEGLKKTLAEDGYKFLSVDKIQVFTDVEWSDEDDEIFFKSLAWDALTSECVGYGVFNGY